MNDKINENEQLTTYDVTWREVVLSKDHVSNVAIESLERDMAPHYKF